MKEEEIKQYDSLQTSRTVFQNFLELGPNGNERNYSCRHIIILGGPFWVSFDEQIATKLASFGVTKNIS
jgi:hypothetical protein